MKKIKYYFGSPKYQDKEIAEELIKTLLVTGSPRSSCWWSKLKAHLEGTSGTLEYIKSWQRRNIGRASHAYEQMHESVNTAKGCPAIINVLQNSQLLLAPCDLIITVNDKQEYISGNPGSDLVTISSHSVDQFHAEGSNIFKGKMNIKFSFPIFIETDSVPYIFLDPQYHNEHFFTVVNGCVAPPFTKGQPLNLNVLLDIPKTGVLKTYTIKKGDVLAYLWFPEKMKLVHTDKHFHKLLERTNWIGRNTYIK